jgi:hypothetical protein
LVTNLDVLQAQNIMQSVKHDLDRSSLEIKVNYLKLKLAMGESQ